MKTRKFNFLYILLMMGLIVLPISCDDDAFLEEDLRDALSPATFYNNDAEAALAVNGVMMGLISNNGHRNRQYASMSHYGSDEGGPSRGNVAGVYHNYLYEEGVEADMDILGVFGTKPLETQTQLWKILKEMINSNTFRDHAIGQLLTIIALIYWELTVMWGDVLISEIYLVQRCLKKLKEHQLLQLEQILNLILKELLLYFQVSGVVLIVVDLRLL